LADGTILFHANGTRHYTEEAKMKSWEEVAWRVGSWGWTVQPRRRESIYWCHSGEIVEVDDNYNPTLAGGIEFHGEE
jgi:hypothetical protein